MLGFANLIQLCGNVNNNPLLDFELIELLNLLRHLRDGVLMLLAQAQHRGLPLNCRLLQISPKLLDLGLTLLVQLNLLKIIDFHLNDKQIQI